MSLIDHLQTVISLLKNIKTNHLNETIPDEPGDAEGPFRTGPAFEKFKIQLVNRGEKVFKQFFLVGCQAIAENVTSFKDLTCEPLAGLVQDTGRLIVDVQTWLLDFLGNYPYLKIHIDEYEEIDNDAMEVRSGFQFMLDLFKGVDAKNLDVALDNLMKEIVDFFDSRIRLAKELIEVHTNLNGEMHSHIPKSHTWWF